jgi:hypothetical protein
MGGETMSRNINRKTSISPTFAEPLEARALLSADLSGTWIGLGALPAISSGAALPPVTLHLLNTGDAPAKGAVAEIYLSDDNTLDTLGDIKLATVKLPTLPAGITKDVLLKNLLLSPGLEAGDRFLIAKLDATTKVVESDENNNNVVSDAALTIEQPDYDLTTTLATPKLGLNLVQGVDNKGSVKVTITNPGTAKIPKVKVDIAFFLRPVGNNDSSGDIAVGTLVNKSANIAPGLSKTYTGKLLIGSAVPVGEYHLVAVADTGEALAESDEENNSVVGAETITLAAAFADLGFTTGTETAGPNVPAGSHALVTVNIFNNGNVAATGTVSGTAVAKSEGHPDVTLATVSNIPISVKAGFTKTFKIPVSFPLLLINGVLYDIHVTITPVTTVGGDNTSNNTGIIGDQFSATIPTILAPDLGDRIKFSNESAAPGDGTNGNSHKVGNFVDGNGRTGTYDYRNITQFGSETGELRLTWANDGLQPTFKAYTLGYGNQGGPNALKNKTLRIVATPNTNVYGQLMAANFAVLGYAEFK